LNEAAGQERQPKIYGDCIGFVILELGLGAAKSMLNLDKFHTFDLFFDAKGVFYSVSDC
jgi:hypothetical protein